MGESNACQMRGTEMDDVIFSAPTSGLPETSPKSR